MCNTLTIRGNIQISSIFVVSLLLTAVLTSAIQLAAAQDNQTEIQESIRIQGVIDELLQVHPVLSELMEGSS